MAEIYLFILLTYFVPGMVSSFSCHTVYVTILSYVIIMRIGNNIKILQKCHNDPFIDGVNLANHVCWLTDTLSNIPEQASDYLVVVLYVSGSQSISWCIGFTSNNIEYQWSVRRRGQQS